MIVDGDVDGIFVGKLVEQFELFGLGFAHEGFHAHFVAKLEELAAGCFFLREIPHVVGE